MSVCRVFIAIFEELYGILEPLKSCLSLVTPNFIFCYIIGDFRYIYDLSVMKLFFFCSFLKVCFVSCVN
jgi:hypothetical protein